MSREKKRVVVRTLCKPRGKWGCIVVWALCISGEGVSQTRATWCRNKTLLARMGGESQWRKNEKWQSGGQDDHFRIAMKTISISDNQSWDNLKKKCDVSTNTHHVTYSFGLWQRQFMNTRAIHQQFILAQFVKSSSFDKIVDNSRISRFYLASVSAN